jgi:hypothetical protein
MSKQDVVLIILAVVVLVGLAILITALPGKYYEVSW